VAVESDFRRRRFLAGVGTTALATALSGCSSDGDDGDDGDDGATETPTEPPGLTIEQFVYCAEQPGGYDDYEKQPDATYDTNDTIWVYLDILNVGSEDAGDDTIAVDLSETLTVTGPDGETVLEEDFHYDNEFNEGIDMETFFLNHNIVLPTPADTGEYEVTVSLEDGITGDSTERTEPFTAE
jgi:hypothetical protein